MYSFINFLTDLVRPDHVHPFFEGHIVLAFYGWIIWNILMFSLAKDKVDDEAKSFDMKRYWLTHWDNMLVTGALTPVLVLFADDLWMYMMGYTGTEYVFSDIAYLGVGVFVTFIYWILKKLAK